jgi:cystathionine gamma-synthase
MAAISAVLSLFQPGDHILFSDDLYGGTFRLMNEIYLRYGIEFTMVDTSDLEEVRRNIRKNTVALFIETPSNPMMKVTDIEELSKLAKINNALLIVDNTFLTPYYQKPLLQGADIVVHSGTKYLCGHNDVVAGFVAVGDNNTVIEKLTRNYMSVGAILSPNDSWLMLRGIKTLAVRLDRQQENAIRIANWLKEQKEVTKVYYVGLEEHIGYDINKKQSKGYGAMISFIVKDRRMVEAILENVKVIFFAESLGGVESLITYPIKQTYEAIPAEIKYKLGITDTLLRLSVGIEDARDLIADLDYAFRSIGTL